MIPHSPETREAVRAAARWLALLDSGDASETDLLRLAQWRASSSLHEDVWQKASLLRQRFTALPGTLAMATLDRPDAGRRALLKQALGIAALLPTAWLVSRELPLDAWTADMHTSVGERRQVLLSDGTSVQLNTDSAVDIDLGARRLTLLRGEVAIKVPANLSLTLQVPYGQVVLGGGEVCLRLIDQACRVSIVEGVASLQPLRGPAQVLQAGQQANLHVAGFGPVTGLDEWRLGWREGVLRLDDRPLGELLHELRRYRPGVLRWAPELERLRVTGTFRLDDTDRVLALLAASLPLQVRTRTRYWVSLGARENRA
ncbi:sugar ABC transporter substrate-binding protein [Pseudomonas monteilii]|uniref:FecR domain-containing protein n=1 Tax=Pseudomonas kurunegalensis TaxID=485880 RepID=A0ACC5UIB9_9PSED|nr:MULTISPECIES: FecR domain-containing protein [Pseudomonas]AVH38519.1 sugar ABC transporter substrate-binding protein [Pseudomonas monteilii]MBV4514194.1 FecR domain-containing protein [Pseudomonas kurunegalensis]MBZ3663694.1 FecR domain-containing protein [Pseudomonas monteilii]MBZ3669039.1 FecR domain-containing protein [Pseudomonas monteilii]BBV97032.1 sugar ABC transporter substrate-binding protein [Pseudomonas monteilii]